jgi:hypothetical protein
MNKKRNKKKSPAQEAADLIRKPVPPPGHAHETVKDYKRRPKHRKSITEDNYDTQATQ